MLTLNIITLVLVLVGALNWGLVGIFNWNLVSAIFGAGSVIASIIYILVGISALWLILSVLTSKGRVSFGKCDCGCREENHSY